ncbi:MAG: hypothetical protein Q8L37_02940 [Candidatus Gottesmanbacteria bacterium]|nr:hypothetical protein [Candidatus Gottesmanbacteria bacterium]
MMETPIPEIDKTPSVVDRLTTAVKAAGKRVVDQYRSDSVVASWDEAIARITKEASPNLDEKQSAELARRFHGFAQAAGMSASAIDVLLTATATYLSVSFFKAVGNKPMNTEGNLLASKVLMTNDSSVVRLPARHNIKGGSFFGATALGATVLRPARFLLELLGKGAGFGGEKVVGIIRRITQGT